MRKLYLISNYLRAKWKTTKTVLPKKYLADEILEGIPLKAKILNTLVMFDYENWNNGEYVGDYKEKERLTKVIMEDVERYFKFKKNK